MSAAFRASVPSQGSFEIIKQQIWIWWAGDIIGFFTLAPFCILVLLPALYGEPGATLKSLVGQIKRARFSLAWIAVGMMAVFAVHLLAGPRHTSYWHLSVLLQLLVVWLLGSRWHAFFTIVINLALIQMAHIYPSSVSIFEQQVFLAVLTATSLLIAIFTSEMSDKLTATQNLAARLGGILKQESEFPSLISHELRTPITIMLGFSELAELSPHPDEKQELMLRARRRARNFGQLLDRLNLLGGGMQNLAGNEALPLGQVLDQAIRDFREDFDSAVNLPLQVECSEAHVLVRAGAGLRSALCALLARSAGEVNDSAKDISKDTAKDGTSVGTKDAATDIKIRIQAKTIDDRPAVQILFEDAAPVHPADFRPD